MNALLNLASVAAEKVSTMPETASRSASEAALRPRLYVIVWSLTAMSVTTLPVPVTADASTGISASPIVESLPSSIVIAVM